ncbi:MAG: flagellar motor protein MotB [Candidatus Omnitrophota bacterium]
MKNKIMTLAIVGFLAVSLAGCTFIFQKGRRSDIEKIEELSSQLEELNRAKMLLEDRLSQEILDKQVKLEMLEKGLVITVVGDLLFDSGKDKIRLEAYSVLDKIATVLQENLASYNVGIEGHTDNQPIKFSGWKSNWELSAHRALSVLNHLEKEKGIYGFRLSAIGYGEYHPVASNDTVQGCQLNRRVEIIVSPKYAKPQESKRPKTSEKIK